MPLPLRRALPTARRRGLLRLAAQALALLSVLAVPAGGAQARPQASPPPFAGWVGPWTSTEWTGAWAYKDTSGTTFGTLVLAQAGSQVSGEWTPTKEWAAANPGHPRGEVWKLECTATTRHTTPPNPDPSVCKGRRAASSYPPGAYASATLFMEWDLKSFKDYNFFGGNTAYRVGPVPAEFGKPAAGKPPTTTTEKDTSAPVVRVYAPAGIQKPGTYVTLGSSVKDDSGRATLIATLYDGGEPVRSARGTGAATGQRLSWRAPLRADLKGPLFFCAWAEDAVGNKSARPPRSACAWVPLKVDIDLVSNTCGGAGWEIVVAVENTFGNSSSYVDDASGHSYTVNFAAACDLHDAGYGGQTVADKINKDVVDFHGWSRKRVDDKFRADLAKLCRRQIPPSAASALSKCIRDDRRYLIVRAAGHKFFDANLMEPGTQGDGHRDNR